jgi:integrase
MPRRQKDVLSNDREVKAAKPPLSRTFTGRNAKTYDVAEYRIEGTANLILRVAPASEAHPAGRRSWTYRLKRPTTGKWAKYSIGEYPAVGLADARKEAIRLQRMVIDGEDPVATRHGFAEIPTVRELGADFISRYAKPKKRSWAEDERQLERNVYPTLGDYRADLVTKVEVGKLLDAIEDRGAPVAANRTMAIVRKMYNWAIATRGLKCINPAAKVGMRGDEQPVERTLSDAELRQLWEALDGHGFDDVTADALRFALIIGARIAEVTGMSRDELALQGGRLLWTVPKKRAKKGADIVRPLSPLALAIVRNRLDDSDSRYVFASPFDDEAPIGPKVPTRAIERAAAKGLVPVGFSSHDLRRTAATGWIKLGVGENVARKLLGHAAKRADVLGRHYDKHDGIPEMVRALRAWERRLMQITAPRDAA